jgi:hypothetical protein
MLLAGERVLPLKLNSSVPTYDSVHHAHLTEKDVTAALMRLAGGLAPSGALDQPPADADPDRNPGIQPHT